MFLISPQKHMFENSVEVALLLALNPCPTEPGYTLPLQTV